jgi:hypothetical protein
MLRQHPHVAFPRGKEIHFWDTHRARGIEWYRGLFAKNAPGVKQGEITPAYAILPVAVIAEIRELSPGARIVYIIRNPVERAWSSALMALGRAEMTIEEASDQWFIDHFRSAGSRARGDFESCIRNWRDVFPAKQLLVMRYEMLRDRPLEFLRHCCAHLDIDPGCYESMAPDALAERFFSGPGLELRPALLPVLQAIYRPGIESLAAYLRADFSDWLRG